MLRLDCVGEEATVQIEDVSSYLMTMSELMTGCEAVMAQIVKVTDVSCGQLMDMFLTVMSDEKDIKPEDIG